MNVNMEWIFDIIYSHKTALATEAQIRYDAGTITQAQYLKEAEFNTNAVIEIEKLEKALKEFIASTNK